MNIISCVLTIAFLLALLTWLMTPAFMVLALIVVPLACLIPVSKK